jgi:hypothetical protein
MLFAHVPWFFTQKLKCTDLVFVKPFSSVMPPIQMFFLPSIDILFISGHSRSDICYMAAICPAHRGRRGGSANMKRILLLLAAVAMLVVALAPAAQAQATSERVNERIPISGSFPNPCTGEVFTFEGTLHLVGHTVVDSSGGVHFKGHEQINAQGVSDTGAKYVFTGVFNEEVTFDIDGESAFTATQTFPVHIIRQGEDGTEEDYHQVPFVTHLTWNANGELTAEVINIEFDCH